MMYTVEGHVDHRWRPVQVEQDTGTATVRTHRWASHYFRRETATLEQGRLRWLLLRGVPLQPIPATRIAGFACEPSRLLGGLTRPDPPVGDPLPLFESSVAT